MTKRATYFYRFEDGYFCWTSGKMDASDLYFETQTHGKVIEIKRN